MAYRHLSFHPSGEPDNLALKAQLGSLRGVLNMDIDSRTNSLGVDYDDQLVSEKQISRCLEEIGYSAEVLE